MNTVKYTKETPLKDGWKILGYDEKSGHYEVVHKTDNGQSELTTWVDESVLQMFLMDRW